MTEQGKSETTDPELREAIAAARSRPGKRLTNAHSPLYEWLWARHSVMAVELNPPKNPNWVALAKTLGALGIFDAKGQPPKPITVRQTWAKVNRAKGIDALGGTMQRQRSKKPAAAAALLVDQAQASSPPAATTPMPVQLPPGIKPVEPDPPAGRYKFRMAGGPKIWGKDEPKPE